MGDEHLSLRQCQTRFQILVVANLGTIMHQDFLYFPKSWFLKGFEQIALSLAQSFR